MAANQSVHRTTEKLLSHYEHLTDPDVFARICRLT
jgi:hypothetical protein